MVPLFALLYTVIETTRKGEGQPSRDRYVQLLCVLFAALAQKKIVSQVQMAAPCSTAGHAFSSVLAAPL
jgi:hypothetical protein